MAARPRVGTLRQRGFPPMTNPPQTYANHRAIPPQSFIVAGLVFATSIVWHGIVLARAPSTDAVIGLLVALALMTVLFASRRNAQIMQDRIIRLEMRLRLERLLPPARHADLDRLSLPQLIALRFASDAELPALVERALAGSLAPNAIKRQITVWQSDWLRV
jgi:hypothetical protein